MSQTQPATNNSLAVVHDWLSSYSGSERLLAEIMDLYPQAQLHALLYSRSAFENTPLAKYSVTTTLMQRLPGIHKHYRSYLPLMPLAIERLDLNRFPIVLSLSHAVAHGVRTQVGQTHVAYICTPMRYAWHLQEDYLNLHGLNGSFAGWLARSALGFIRTWDRKAAQRADHMLAISEWTAGRIKQVWGRKARVIYPPVDLTRFKPVNKRENFYLVVTRLVPYKRVATIVEAFNQLKLPLLVVGTGPEKANLAQLAGPNVTLLDNQPDEVVTDLMNRAKAFVYMAVEDFGMAMAEAQAAGCPVIAYRQGGAAEIVVDGETGLLFDTQSMAAMVQALEEFERRKNSFDARLIQKNAQRFARQRFRDEFSTFLNSLW